MKRFPNCQQIRRNLGFRLRETYGMRTNTDVSRPTDFVRSNVQIRLSRVNAILNQRNDRKQLSPVFMRLTSATFEIIGADILEMPGTNSINDGEVSAHGVTERPRI